RYKLLEKLTSASKTREERVKTIKNAIKELGKNIGSGDPRNATIKLELVMRDLRDTQSELRKTKQLLSEEMAQGKPEGAGAVKVPESILEEYISRNPKVAELLDKIAKSEATLAEARKHVVQPDDPAVRRIESQLTLQKNELESLRKQ